MENYWEIIDNNGVVYSGQEDEMWEVWNRIEAGEEDIEWDGDLQLVQIHAITR